MNNNTSNPIDKAKGKKLLKTSFAADKTAVVLMFEDGVNITFISSKPITVLN
jgi:hypothetical protein